MSFSSRTLGHVCSTNFTQMSLRTVQKRKVEPQCHDVITISSVIMTTSGWILYGISLIRWRGCEKTRDASVELRFSQREVLLFKIYLKLLHPIRQQHGASRSPFHCLNHQQSQICAQQTQQSCRVCWYARRNTGPLAGQVGAMQVSRAWGTVARKRTTESSPKHLAGANGRLYSNSNAFHDMPLWVRRH
jgi:hypothetical protein